MVIEPKAAQIFIVEYARFLIQVNLLSNGKKADVTLLELLYAARNVVVANPAIIELAVARLAKKKEPPIPPEVLKAIHSLQLRQWVYLRDTKAYSIFLSDSETDAYAVCGLTERLRDIFGGTGLVCNTGIVEFAGHFVCDGIISYVARLGPGYRKGFSAEFDKIKKNGGFHKFVAP